MKAAKQLDMVSGNFAFITLDLNTDVFYKDGRWTGNEGENSTRFPEELNGIVDLSVYRPAVSKDFEQRYNLAKKVVQADIRPFLVDNVSSVFTLQLSLFKHY